MIINVFGRHVKFLERERARMTTTAAVENKAGHPGEKEKMDKRRALGRGLESLLPRPRVAGGTVAPPPPSAGPVPAPVAVPASSPGASILPPVAMPGAPVVGTLAVVPQVSASSVVNLALADIDRNPFQTRHVNHDAALEELAESIKTNGVVQPIVVRPSEEPGRYVLILGERRLHASKKAGNTTIPAIVRRVSPQQAAEMTIVENLQREDLSPLEQAEAFRVLSQEFNLTQAQIGERVGLSRESVANYMRLLKLPRDVMQLLSEKKLNFAAAKELLKLDGDAQITKAALEAVNKRMSLEQIERLVLHLSGLDVIPGEEKASPGARWVDPNVRAAQMDIERLLGVRVKIRDRKGKGKIVIEYSTVDDYERVVGMLRGQSS